MDGIVIVRNDRLVAEAYFNGYARETQHDMRSVTKSFTASLAGIAIEQGLITLDDTLPQHINRFAEFDNVDDRKRSIRIANCSTCKPAWIATTASNHRRAMRRHMYRHDDWIKYILSVPMQADPGHDDFLLQRRRSRCSAASSRRARVRSSKSSRRPI